METPLLLTPALRGAIFFGLLGVMLLLEVQWPRRKAGSQRALRWPANLGLAATDSAMLWLMPLAAVSTALWASARGWGLFHAVDWPVWLEMALAWVVLDCAIYWQHRAFHEIRALWPLHRAHHTDIEFDATTAVRFHPAEIFLSVLFKSAVVIALGAAPLAVLLLETTVSSFALFNHANLRLPPWLENTLSRLIVTPDLHRIHHSVHRDETDSNYGSSLVLWDKLFASYVAQPRDGHETMRIGLEEFRDEREQKLASLLSQPVR